MDCEKYFFLTNIHVKVLGETTSRLAQRAEGDALIEKQSQLVALTQLN